jgi:hypothetical protein
VLKSVEKYWHLLSTILWTKNCLPKAEIVKSLNCLLLNCDSRNFVIGSLEIRFSFVEVFLFLGSFAFDIEICKIKFVGNFSFSYIRYWVTCHLLNWDSQYKLFSTKKERFGCKKARNLKRVTNVLISLNL